MARKKNDPSTKKSKSLADGESRKRDLKKNDISDSVAKTIVESIDSHDLVKVKFIDFSKKDEAIESLPTTDEGSEFLSRRQDHGPEKLLQSDGQPTPTQKVSKKYLVNKLNYLNFQNSSIIVNFKHKKYNHKISCHAFPQPCINDQLDCFWGDQAGKTCFNKAYEFDSIIVPDEPKSLFVKSEKITLSEKGFSISLPKICHEIDSRRLNRHLCYNIYAQMVQNGAVFSGKLVDFNSRSLRIDLIESPPQTFQWINPDATISLILSISNYTVYTGDCRITAHNFSQKPRSYILKPLSEKIQRYKPKEFRSTRQELVPSPDVVFQHPFTKKIITLKIVDLSGAGFAVIEEEKNSVLLPGMIIPEAEINFASSFKMKCKAQVVHRTTVADMSKDSYRCGFAILDMDVKDHERLLAMLHHANDGNSYLSNVVDLESLWEFFFDTGFIYPEKYSFLNQNKEEIKATYKKLYSQNPSIARHFIYQSEGQILAHMAMLRFYENSWMIHHHASRSASNRAGLMVLNQIGRLINDSHSLESIHMNFVFCYFRQSNKFANRIFGGIAQRIENTKGCHIDSFAYLHYEITQGPNTLPQTWELIQATDDDIRELKLFYEHASGGLIINAFDLDSMRPDYNEIFEDYRRLNLIRERHLLCLKKHGELKALFVINLADFGLNMSDLTNCVSLFILDQDDLPKNILQTALAQSLAKYSLNSLPILLYPISYADKQAISYEKKYSLWILNMHYTDHYFRYLKRMLKFIQH